MPFDEAALKAATSLFDVVVAGDQRRALALDPVLRWTQSYWAALSEAMLSAGFEIQNPRHLAALQYLIDQACEL